MKLQAFVSHLHMKLAGNTSRFLKPQHQLQYSFGLLMGQGFAQVEAYITDKGINLTDVPVLITVFEMVFEDLDRVTRAEQKLEALKHMNHDITTY
jgi:hypothetical protein